MARHVAIDAVTQLGLCGEQVLVATLLKQTIVDLASPNTAIRKEAIAFLHDGMLVEFWTSLAGIDPEAWQEHAQQVLQHTREE